MKSKHWTVTIEVTLDVTASTWQKAEEIARNTSLGDPRWRAFEIMSTIEEEGAK